MGWKLSMAELRLEAAVNEAKIGELHAKASKLLAEANGVDIQLQISAINASIGAARTHQDGVLGAMNAVQKVMDHRQKGEMQNGNNERGTAKMAPESSDAGAATGSDQPQSGG